jgi:3-dehydroquinate dehydratase type I
MICVPIVARDTEEAIEKIQRADVLADMLEFRLDLMESFHIREMVRAASKPVIATYRSVREGGKGSADYAVRARILTEAMEAGTGFVDVEYGLPLEVRQRFLQVPRRHRVILSIHNTVKTPERSRLDVTLKAMVATGADVLKIVTLARRPEDNLRVLELIAKARWLETEIIAFCMGPLGRVSRVASTPMGAYMTFAALGNGEESAGGQIPVREMRDILTVLGTHDR